MGSIAIKQFNQKNNVNHVVSDSKSSVDLDLKDFPKESDCTIWMRKQRTGKLAVFFSQQREIIKTQTTQTVQFVPARKKKVSVLSKRNIALSPANKVQEKRSRIQKPQRC